jgi:putative tryptophan/tyrosine transport system substrate-binding protein
MIGVQQRYARRLVKPISHLPWSIGPLALLFAAALLWRQDTARQLAPPVIAFVGSDAEGDDAGFANLRSALQRGWLGDTMLPVLRYYRSGFPDEDALQRTIRAALFARPAVLVAPTAAAAKIATSISHDSTTVFASYPDPVRFGLVEAMRRPGRRTTGVSLFDDLHLKRLEILRDAFPRIRRVGVLADRSWLDDFDLSALTAQAASRLGLQLVVHEGNTPDSVDALMIDVEALACCDAWYIPPSYLAYAAEARIIGHVRRLKVPSMHATEGEVTAGALLAYSQDGRFVYDALADLARRAVQGEDAGTIPIQRPYRYTLSVRIEPDAPWAHIEPSVVRRADRVHRP